MSCVVSCAAADFICFVSVFFLFLCSVCFAYQSVRNQTQKCCVILHCRQQQQLQNKTKETERKKKLYKPFYLWLCSSFWLPFWTGNFYVVTAVVVFAVAAACAIETRWRCMLGAYVCLNASGQTFFESPKR